ncbi:MAG: hypothetical protein C4310_12835, partial [Chloroflexota bacterium]
GAGGSGEATDDSQIVRCLSSNMSDQPKFVIEHLSVTYEDGTEPLRDISLTIYANEITVLFGPAGGGKST